MSRPRRPWLLTVLIAIDQLANALARGDEDETISSRCFKAQGRCVLCRALCWALGLIDPDHCAKSVEWDEGEAPPPQP